MIAAPRILRSTHGAAIAIVVGMSVFSLQDPIIKALSGTYPVTEAIAFRGAFALPLFTWMVWQSGGLRLLWKARPFALIGRGTLMMCSYTLYYLALPSLPLTTTVALWFTAPLFMVALSQLILGEHQGRQRWLAVCLGFVGVLVIVRPSGDMRWVLMLPVGAALFYAIGQLTVRRIGQGIPAPVISWHQNTVYLVGAILLASILAPLFQDYSGGGSLGFLLRPWSVPTLHDGLLLAACGPIAAFGSTLIVFAYRSAQPGAVAALEYVMMLWAVIWGFFIFGDLPTPLTIVGAALIIASGIYAVTRPAPDPHRIRQS